MVHVHVMAASKATTKGLEVLEEVVRNLHEMSMFKDLASIALARFIAKNFPMLVLVAIKGNDVMCTAQSKWSPPVWQSST